jgi:hypothetical protein
LVILTPQLNHYFCMLLYMKRQGLGPLISPMLFCLCRLSLTCSVVRHDKQVTSKGGLTSHPHIVTLGSPRFNYAILRPRKAASRNDTFHVSLDVPTLPSCINVQSSSHSFHTNICSDSHSTTFDSDRRFGLVNTDQWELEGNRTVVREREISSAVNHSIHKTFSSSLYIYSVKTRNADDFNVTLLMNWKTWEWKIYVGLFR